MNTLISMTAFVKEYYSDESLDELQTLDLFDNYATFLLQPLTLEMFIPCDDEGNVLEKPNPTNWQNFTGTGKYRDIHFQTAKEKVLFKGFEIEDIGLGSIAIRKNGWIIMRCSKAIGAKWENIDSYFDIESLVGFELELTESALKQIGLNP